MSTPANATGLGLRLGMALGCALLCASCGRPGGPNAFAQSEFPVPDAGPTILHPDAGTIQIATEAKCTPVQSSSPLPARTTIEGASSDAGVQADTYLTSDLYNQFKAICGGCHVDSNLGNFHVTSSTFPMVMADGNLNVLNRYIKSDDPSIYTPPAVSPNAMPFSQRADSDPVKQLANLLGIWITAGTPVGSFTLPTQASAAVAGYSLTTSLGSQLTNIGSCIPNKEMVGGSVSAMDQMDSFFAQATALPPTLDQTDLISLDSKTLAQNGVISFAPELPALERRRRQDALHPGAARAIRQVRQSDAEVHDSAQHALLQDVSQADHRRQREPYVSEGRDAFDRVPPGQQAARRNRAAECALRNVCVEQGRDGGAALG